MKDFYKLKENAATRTKIPAPVLGHNFKYRPLCSSGSNVKCAPPPPQYTHHFPISMMIMTIHYEKIGKCTY